MGHDANAIKFDKNKCEQIAYIIGVLKGDGDVNIYKSKTRSTHYRIRLRAPEGQEPLALSFKQSLEQIGLHPRLFLVKTSRGRTKRIITVIAYSREFVRWYLSLKPEDVEKYVSQNERSAIAFIRALYECEGTIYYGYRWKGKRSHNKQYSIRIGMKDLQTIKLLKKLIESFLGIKPYLFFHNGLGILGICTKRAVEDFLKQVNPSIKNPIKKLQKEQIMEVGLA
jgi:hypothetical protein